MNCGRGNSEGIVESWAATFLAATQLLRDMLYEVQPVDPAVFAIASLLIALTGVLAAYLPARRAAQVDPIIALRYE